MPTTSGTESALGGGAGSLLASILSEDSFRPSEPRTLEETGVSSQITESIVLKYLALIGSANGRQIADVICLPFVILEPLYNAMRQRQLLVHSGSAQLNDYVYCLTEMGRARAKQYMESCSYVGAVPVPLDDYIVSVEAQSVKAEVPREAQLKKAFADVLVDKEFLDTLGPAINSGAGMFLYGAPGNGKTLLARRMTLCFGSSIWIPKVVTDDGQFIKLFDAACHEPIDEGGNSILKASEHDRRWIRIKRPTVMTGGELTMDALELRHDPRSNVSEAPLQLKSNGGCLLIDDFGRQRMEPRILLNRWIVPLEAKVDYLLLATGKKIQVPFDQLIIFSTNLEPCTLADEAFLRRIPYKIEIGDPSRDEFHRLFKFEARKYGCEYKPDPVEYLLEKHYRPIGRPMRRCHPRDFLQQMRNHCTYHGYPVEMRNDYFDRVVQSYFTVVKSAN
jgi:predicted ATPase with chaperone activity